MGTIDNISNSIFRSDNNGATWTVASNPPISELQEPIGGPAYFTEEYLCGSAGNGIYMGKRWLARVTGVTVSPATIAAAAGNRATLTAYVEPAWAANKKGKLEFGHTTKVKVNDSTGASLPV